MRSPVIAALMCVASAAGAAFAGITDPALIITATNSLGTGQYVVHENWGSWDQGTWTWHLPTDYVIHTTDGTPLATLTGCDLLYQNDPAVTLGFNVTNTSGVTTTFTFSSALLSFAPISGATGNASAGVTVTDGNGGGATFLGAYPGNFAYRAQYNGLVPAGTDFGYLISGPVAAPVSGTGLASGSIPATAIPGTVSSASTQFMFSLTAGDLASGTSVFNIVPGPGAGALLALGGLAAMRRRR
jgi:uncharacterized protein (TIGR03382 family)